VDAEAPSQEVIVHATFRHLPAVTVPVRALSLSQVSQVRIKPTTVVNATATSLTLSRAELSAE
jgi:hypothetical protein